MLDKKLITSEAHAVDQRADLGAWLKSLREDSGLSQRQLAALLSLEYYTFISQLENGRGKIPSGRYLDWAIALNQTPRSFVKKLISHYEPSTYAILFGEQDMRNE
jgi:transcriptional regulator with XRE-family HTH domain